MSFYHKVKIINIFKFTIIFIIVFAWIFSGWPQSIEEAKAADFKMEIRKFTDIGTSWTTKSFLNSYTSPVVIVTTEPNAGWSVDNPPFGVNIRNVKPGAVDIRTTLPPRRFGSGSMPSNNTVYMLVVEEGYWDNSNSDLNFKLEAQKFSSNGVCGASYKDIASCTTPINLDSSWSSTPHYYFSNASIDNENSWIETGMWGNDNSNNPPTDTQTKDILVGLSAAEAEPQGSHSDETIHFLTIESGNHIFDSQSFRVLRVSHDTKSDYTENNMINHGASFYPVWGIADVVAMNGSNGGWVNWENIPFDASRMEPYFQEDRYHDSEVSHVPEFIDVLITDTDNWSYSTGGSPPPGGGSSSNNVWGWAWSDTIGWISFNSDSDGSPYDYGVNINEKGILSGYAWSDNVGWITFNQADLSGCPSSPCVAEMDLESGDLDGWAKVLSYDGWIALRVLGGKFGVSLDAPSDKFSGWAWEDTNLGWISFNCNNLGECGTSDYVVMSDFSLPPIVFDLQVEHQDYCSYPAEHFVWKYSDPDGDKQGAYQLQIDKKGDFASFGDGEYDSGKVYSSTNDKLVLVARNPGSGQLAYNTHYYWRMKVWDDTDAKSVNWIYGPEFDTEPHIYPDPDFTWTPETITKGEVVQICAVKNPSSGTGCDTDVSTCYNGGNNPVSCSGESFMWTIPPTAEFASTSDAYSENPRVKFNKVEEAQVNLQIKDDVGTCDITKNMNINLPLPLWKEISP